MPGVEAALLSRALVGGGAHRDLTISLTGLPQSLHGRLVLLQPLPAGLYPDIYQLQAAAGLGQGPRVSLHGRSDVENITLWAAPCVLAIDLGVSSSLKDDSTIASARVPLHARYPLLPGPSAMPWWQSGHSVVLLPAAALLHLPSNGSGHPATLATRAATPQPHWLVPAGNPAAALPIGVLTVACVLSAAGVALRTACTVQRGS